MTHPKQRPAAALQFESFTVGDFMTRGTAVIAPHADLWSAQRYFEKYDVDVLPVVDRLRVVGILSKTDYLRAHSKRSRTSPARDVQSFMTPRPKVFSPSDPLRLVLEEMAVTRHRTFVVTDRDRFVGTIAREAVLRALREAAAEDSQSAPPASIARPPRLAAAGALASRERSSAPARGGGR